VRCGRRPPTRPLRCGELQALRYEDVDLDAGLLHVRRSWDPQAGPVEPKSRAGARDVPIVAALRTHLASHLLRSRRRSGLAFGRGEGKPFDARARSPAEPRRHGRPRS
jgi:integrase